MKVRWSRVAARDRGAIWDYIAADNPGAAARMDQLFTEAAAGLAQFPQMGHRGKVPGTRELIRHEHYRLIYEIDDDTVAILTIVHTARQWPLTDQ